MASNDQNQAFSRPLSSQALSTANNLADDPTFLSFDDYANLNNFLNEVCRLSSLEHAQSLWCMFLYSKEILKNRLS
jgi:hypothetical protein